MNKKPHEASISPVNLTRPEGFEHIGTDQLICELVARIEGIGGDRETARLLFELKERLDAELEAPTNRFSHGHLQELLGTYCFWQEDRDVQGEVFLELGAGAENPLSIASAMVMLGASKAYSLELSPPLSIRRQARAIADIAYWLSMRHDLFPKLQLESMRPRLAKNVTKFDLSRLSQGELDLPEAVQQLVCPAEKTGLPTQSVDRVTSTSFFEHVDEPTAVVQEIARITKPGGLSVHNVDTADHEAYGDDSRSAVQFLLEAPESNSVNGCNRLRIHQVVTLFEAHGFEIVKRIDYQKHEWSAHEWESRVGPFSDMTVAELEPLKSVLVMRRT